MLSCLLSRISSFQKMSRKRITTFFKKTEIVKRKLSDSKNDEAEENNTPLKKTAVLSKLQSTISQIEILAQRNPALSPNIGIDWFQVFEKEFSETYFLKLGEFLKTEKSQYNIFPPADDVYSWTNSFAIHDTKVVILGQDPYVRTGQAHGLAFSVRKGVAIPKSLKNIYAELTKDIPDFISPTHGCLKGWAKQGVLLLNTCLTVREGLSNSHKGKGWENFTDAVIKWINQNLSHVVFILWGNNAQEKCKFISKNKHQILSASHPSPLSAHRGFFGCKHFSKTNEYLRKHNRQGIDWKYLP